MAVFFNLWPPALGTDALPLELLWPVNKGDLSGSATYSRAVWSTALKGLTTWLSFVMLNWVFVTFPCGILGQVWYLIVSIPDVCPFYYIVPSNMHCQVFFFMILLENKVVRQKSNFVQFIHISFKDLLLFHLTFNLTYINYNRYLFWCQSFGDD